MVLVPQADTASLNDRVDTYRVVITNHGNADVKKVTVSLPFVAGYSPDGVSFNRDGVWVSQLGAGSMDIRVELMRGNRDAVSGTVRFVSQGPASTNALQERATVSRRDGDEQIQSVSNLPVRLQPASLIPGTPLPSGEPTSSFRATAFASGEPVNFWVTSASGSSTPLVVEEGVIFVAPPEDDDDDEESYGTSLAAGSQGELLARLNTAGLAPGTYTLAARGGWSELVVSANFTVR